MVDGSDGWRVDDGSDGWVGLDVRMRRWMKRKDDLSGIQEDQKDGQALHWLVNR